MGFSTGAAFLSCVPAGTYDAIIVDAFDPISTFRSQLKFLVLCRYIYICLFLICLDVLLIMIEPDDEIVRSRLFEMVAKALRGGGVLCIQAESIWFRSLDIENLISKCHQVFKGSVQYAWTIVPAYPRHEIIFSV